MRKHTPEASPLSTPRWEMLETWTRAKIQEAIQAVVEEEVTDLLGRAQSARRAAVDAPAGYRNGYGKPRRLACTSGTITVRRPRLRGLEERFTSRVLPLFARRTQEVGALLSELYLHGLAQGDCELALRGLLRVRGGWAGKLLTASAPHRQLAAPGLRAAPGRLCARAGGDLRVR